MQYSKTRDRLGGVAPVGDADPGVTVSGARDGLSAGEDSWPWGLGRVGRGVGSSGFSWIESTVGSCANSSGAAAPGSVASGGSAPSTTLSANVSGDRQSGSRVDRDVGRALCRDHLEADTSVVRWLGHGQEAITGKRLADVELHIDGLAAEEVCGEHGRVRLYEQPDLAARGSKRQALLLRLVVRQTLPGEKGSCRRSRFRDGLLQALCLCLEEARGGRTASGNWAVTFGLSSLSNSPEEKRLVSSDDPS